MDKNLKYAFVRTLPILVGFIFIGAAFGLLANEMGFGLAQTVFMSAVIYAGSLQFALLPIIGGAGSFATIILISLSVSSRQMFYGLSFIERFRKMGRRALFIIYTLCDETYSVLCSAPPADADRDKFDFYAAALNYIYWIAGGAIGNLFGQLITIDITGVDFAMTALFIVICTEQWMSKTNRLPAVVGGVCACLCLAVFGRSSFILPAMILSMAVLLTIKNKVKEAGADE